VQRSNEVFNMAKKIIGFIKLQIPAGKANPSPPVGPALGQRGLNIMEFCKAFNAQTQELHVRSEDAAGYGSDQEGSEDRQGFGKAAHRQGRQDHARSS
jgi:hypothetical protein